MDLNEYQSRARSTAVYPGASSALGLFYVSLGLAGEAGELAGKVSKAIRDDSYGDLDEYGEPNDRLDPDRLLVIMKELGDVLWYVAMIAVELGLDLNSIAEANLNKLKSRAERGQLGGSGDER